MWPALADKQRIVRPFGRRRARASSTTMMTLIICLHSIYLHQHQPRLRNQRRHLRRRCVAARVPGGRTTRLLAGAGQQCAPGRAFHKSSRAGRRRRCRFSRPLWRGGFPNLASPFRHLTLALAPPPPPPLLASSPTAGCGGRRAGSICARR